MLSEGRAMFPQLFKRENEEIFLRPKKTSLENGKEDHCMYFHKMIGTFATNTTEKYTFESFGIFATIYSILDHKIRKSKVKRKMEFL